MQVVQAQPAVVVPAQQQSGCCNCKSCNCWKVWSALLACAQWIFFISGMAGTYWWQQKSGLDFFKMHGGCFSNCYISIICRSYYSHEEAGLIGAAGGILGFGVFIQSIGTILTFVACCCTKKKGVSIACGVLLAISTFFNLVGYIVGVVRVSKWEELEKSIKVEIEMGYSAHLTILAFLFGLMATIFQFVASKKDIPVVDSAVVVMQPSVAVVSGPPPPMQQPVYGQPAYAQPQQQQPGAPPPVYSEKGPGAM